MTLLEKAPTTGEREKWTDRKEQKTLLYDKVRERDGCLGKVSGKTLK